MQQLLKRTWAEIDLDCLAHNYRALKSLTPGCCGFVGVVKADAYGHGAVMVSKVLEELGARYLAVSNLEEALQLRKADIRLPILILGYTPPEFAAELADSAVTQAVNALDYARQLSAALAAAGKRLAVHVKVDTGMSRMGFTAYGAYEHAVQDIAALSRLPALDLEGIFTHFAVSDESGGVDYTELQFERFMGVIDKLAAQGVTFRLRHCANTGATVNHPKTHLDLFRPGIATYGLYTGDELEHKIGLKPVMALRSAIAQIKDFEPEVTVSYGRTYTTEGKRRLAVVPIGYADGLPRRFSGQRDFLVRGRRAPQVGRICMDMCMIDVTDIPEAQVGDTVTIFGRDGDEFIPMKALSDMAGTITYEIACGISKRVPRIFYRHGEAVGVLQYII